LQAGLYNVTYTYTYYKKPKILNNSHTTEDVRTVIYDDQVVQLTYG